MALTTKVLLNTTRQKNDGTYQLIIRLTYNRKVINIPVGINLKEKDWDARTQRIKASSNFATNITRQNNKIQNRIAHIHDVITKLEDDGSIQALELKDVKKIITTGNFSGEINVFDFIDDLIADLIKAKKQGNARVYKSLKVKLEQFHGHAPLSFKNINYTFIKKLEIEHFSNGGGTGGLSVYLRTLRALYNKAINSGYAAANNYPFKDYTIKKGEPQRRSLTEQEFQKFKTIDLKTKSTLCEARKLFMASFYMRGMNWIDMCMLKKSNLSSTLDRLTYTRSKTGKHFSIKLHENLLDIFSSYGLHEKKKDDFLFPILKPEHNPDRYHTIITNRRERLNKQLNQIAKACDINSITIYTARHTYATIGKRRGVPTAIIQESLGHKTEVMTQTYLDSFDNQVVDEYDMLIMGE